MTLEDVMFNWLQMRYVVEQRPDDKAAYDTYAFFTDILEQDHGLANIQVASEGPVYKVSYVLDHSNESKTFPIEFVHQLLHDIAKEPKYND